MKCHSLYLDLHLHQCLVCFFNKKLENLFTHGLSFKLKFYQLICISHVMDIALKVETSQLK